MEYLKELLWSVHGKWHYFIRLWLDLHETSWLSNNSPSSTALIIICDGLDLTVYLQRIGWDVSTQGSLYKPSM